MEPKKISFGFSKISKKPSFMPVKASKPEQQIELIKCLEGQEIKLVQETKETAPLIIPMKEIGKTSAALASLIRRRAVLLGEDDEPVDSKTSDQTKSNANNVDDPSNDDLDKRAAREILADLQKNKETVQDSGLVLPILKPDELPLDGAKESNLEDYESIPIEQYGLALLRGMGWKEPPPSKEKKLIDEAPTVRPKGMGLGADKALKAKPLLVQPEANETLAIKKQAYVRILGGKYKDAYGQIEGFDDEAGRVIVKLAIGGAREAFNEFLCQPISKKEFSQYGKCINTAKYEEYKKLENEHGQIIVKKEEQSIEPKFESDEKKVIKMEIDVKPKSISTNDNYDNNEKKPSRQRYDEYAVSSNSRDRARVKSRSRSRSRKNNSSRKPHDERHGDDVSGSSTDESDTDSAYERKHKHHKKSKSKSKNHERKSKSSKKKSKHRDSSNESSHHRSYKDSSLSDESGNERQNRHSNKKNKKKTKKSKKQRSRTPNRHRR